MPLWLDMLNSSQQQTANLFARADQALNALSNQRIQKEQFQVNTAFRMAEMAEQSRFNDAQIENLKLENFYRAQSYELQKELMPLKIQEAQLALEARRADAERQHLGNVEGQFNSITAPFDSIVAGKIFEFNDPKLGEEYMRLKQDYKERAMRGETFDGGAYEAKMNDIIGRATKQAEGFNGEVSQYVGSLSPELGKTYETRNPLKLGTVQGVRNGLLFGDEKTFAASLPMAGQYLPDEEIKEISIGRNAISSHENQAERYREKAKSVIAQISITDDPEQKKKLMEQAIELQDKASEEDRRADKTRDALLRGEKIPTVWESPTEKGGSEEPPKEARTLNEIINEMNARGGGDASSPLEDVREKDREIDARTSLRNLEEDLQFDYRDEKGQKAKLNPLEGLDLAEFAKLKRRGAISRGMTGDRFGFGDQGAEALRQVRATVTKNIQGLDDSEILSLFKNPMLDEILAQEGVSVDSMGDPGWLHQAMLPGAKKSFFVGQGSPEKTLDTYRKQHYFIKNRNDLMKLLDKQKDRPTARFNAIDIYSSIVTAAIARKMMDSAK